MQTRVRATLLVVDDDVELGVAVEEHLAAQGYAVHRATEAAGGRRLVAEHAPDLCLLDIVMPGTSGKVLCREIAERTSASVIMMSSLSGAETIAALLELGADDYVVKPFEMIEIAARVRAVLRRRARERPAPVPGEAGARIGGWTFDPAERRLMAGDGRSVALTPGEVGVLRFLCANPGVTFGRDDLLAVSRARQHGGASDRAIDNLVKRLRRKLEPDPDAPRHLMTVWGQGYRLDP